MSISIDEDVYLPTGVPYDPILVMAAIAGATILINAVTEIANGTIVNDHIAASTIVASQKIVAASIEADQIATDAITATKLMANSVISDKIQADAITAVKIAAGAITSDKIEGDAITAVHLSAGSVSADAIDSNAITADKIDADAITTVKIQAQAVTSEKIASGAITAVKMNVTSLSAIAADLGTITSGSVTASTIQTSANPDLSRVVMNSGGLTGFSAILGQTFRIPTDGSQPVFASGQIQSSTIIDSLIISSEFQTSSELPYMEITDSGVAYRSTALGDGYGTDLYGVDVYGAGVDFYLGKSDRPALSMETDRAYADIRLYAGRSANPSSGSTQGDIIAKSNYPYYCTTAGNPGTYQSILLSDGDTGGSGTAGDGKQYVEINIAGTVYKVLHDGTV
jgi:hypothetical protein